MADKVLVIIVVLLAIVGLLYYLRKEQKSNRCDGCSLKEECHRNEKECKKR